MLSLYIFILNLFFFFYIFSNNHYAIFCNNHKILPEDFYLPIMTLLFFNLIFIFIKNHIFTEQKVQDFFSKYFSINVQYVLFFIKAAFLVISFYYFIGLSTIFMKVFLIENQILNLDGIIKVGWNYTLQRVYSDQEKISYAIYIFNQNIDLLNSTYNTNVSIQISPEITNAILDFKTLKEIKDYCISTSQLLFDQQLQTSTNTNNVFYTVIKYTALVIIACSLGYMCYHFISLNTSSNDLVEATKIHVNTVSQDIKQNKTDIGNLGARQVEINHKWSELSETNVKVLDKGLTSNIKHIDSSIDLLKLIQSNRSEALDLMKSNQSTINEIQQKLNEDNVQFIFSDKVLNILKVILTWNEKYNGSFFDALEGGLHLLFELAPDNDSKTSFKNINDDKPKIKPFSGKGHVLDDKK